MKVYNNKKAHEEKRTYDKDAIQVVKYLQSAYKRHILDGSSLYNKIYGKGSSQTQKTAREKHQ